MIFSNEFIRNGELMELLFRIRNPQLKSLNPNSTFSVSISILESP